MTIQLVPMKEADFVWYRETLAVAYAQEQIESGKWDAATALQQSRESIARSLPEGLATKDNRLYLLMSANTPDPVGQLWIRLDNGFEPSAFIMDIEIHTPYQRRGYAQAALTALEVVLKPLGINKIALYVHAHNHGAQALYQKMGYFITGHAMLKNLDQDT